MNQFHWKGSQPSNTKSAATVNTAGTSAGGDLSGIKIQPNQHYKAQIVPLPNQATSHSSNQVANQTTRQSRTTSSTNHTGKPVAQIQISIPQPNGQSITLSQPLPALPQGINANQQFQVLLDITKGGQLSITLSPGKHASDKHTSDKHASNLQAPDKQTANKQPQGANITTNTATNAFLNQSSGQTVKLSLSNSQIIDLLSLNKAFKNINNSQTAQTGSQIQTTAKVIQQSNQGPQLKLPGSTGNIKLPDNIASLLQNQKTVSVSLKAQGQDITLQIDLAKTANNKNATAQLTTTITAEKLSPIIKQALNQSANQQVTVTKHASTDKIQLSNQQTLSLGGKIAALQQGAAQLKVSQLSAGQLTIQINNTNKGDSQATSIKINIPSAQVSNNIKQALVSSQQLPLDKTAKPDNAKSLNANQTIENTKIVSTGKTDTGANKEVNTNQLAQESIAMISTTKNNPDMQIQKQALQQFIDPLIRLLLPKKQNWSEGFKTLAALEQSIKPNPRTTDIANKPQTTNQPTTGQNSTVTASNQSNIDLKQLINQVKEAIPDHTANLDDKAITTMISEILNFSPTKTATPTVQPTPANAIANALQLLLGAKLSQGESKLSNQLQQQLQQLIKPMAPKAPATEAGIKKAMQGLTNLDQATGSLKALTSIQSTIRHQQVENVEKRLDGNSQLEFSFPLRVDNQVKELHIAINEEKHKNETSSSRLSIWNLNLTFDLNDFGKLLVNAKLKDGEVSMHMYAEQPKTLSLMKQFSATLEQRLEFHGVKINNIQSSLGKISSTNSKRQLNSLVQIKV